jgi:hypothetical protein
METKFVCNINLWVATTIKWPLKNANFCSRSSKAIILTTPEEYASHSTGQAGIHYVFRGLQFEPDPGETGFAPMKYALHFIG